ncbi:hypothetical protein ABPG77_000102 [Micractinium sp. CCAP 211/92]
MCQVRSESDLAPTLRNLKRPPQFILFSHDDNVDSAAYGYVTDVTDRHRNPNGCRIKATWFGCTSGCPFSCSTAKKLHGKGHELAAHTVNHPDLRRMSYSQVKKEIVGSRDKIASCGIPQNKVVGFRTPFLSDSPTVRKVLANSGFRYDSTIGVAGGSNRLWPATMEKGVPYNCNQAGQYCTSSEAYPGLWQVPLYELPTGNLMDVCTDESSGKPQSGCSPYKQLRKDFDRAYGSNRGPVTVGVHSTTTGFLKNDKFRSEVNRFFEYALQHKDVWVVTISQFLDWMEAPVEADKMAAFMAKYKC